MNLSEKLGAPKAGTGDASPKRFAAATSSTTVALPAPTVQTGQKKSTIAMRFVTIKAVGCNVQHAFGLGSAPSLTLNQLSSFASPSAACGPSLSDGESRDMVVPAYATHWAYVCDNTTGFVEFWVSDELGQP